MLDRFNAFLYQDAVLHQQGSFYTLVSSAE